MILYHGSSVDNITILEPRSILHGSQNEKVVYLSGSIPYALVYIWDSQKTKCSRKHVTCALKNGVVYYEELFPDQLRAFYEGVSGYLYCIDSTDNIQHMPKTHEEMYYSLKAVQVKKVVFVSDVYRELLRYEKESLFKVDRFNDASKETQAERIEKTAKGIEMCNWYDTDTEKAHFMKHYFKQAWELAESRRIK